MQPMHGYGAPQYGGPPGPPGPPGPQGPPGAYGASGYEFSSVENLTIGNVARYARLWGIISLVTGILLLIMGGVVAIAAGAVAAANHASSGPLADPAALGIIGVALIPTALVSVVGGIFYMKSGAALRAVVDTQGDDIRLLTNAVRSLSVAFKIEAIAMAVSFVLGLFIGVFMRAGGHS